MARARRQTLTRDRVMQAAMAVADAGGVGGLTIRSLAQALGVKPMTLYHHVAGKEAILDGITDAVFAQIDLPTPGEPWRPAMRRRAHSARDVLRRHPWALVLLESRSNPGPATLRHHDAVIGTLRAAGFSPAMTAHAVALLDAYVYGFALQEATLPFEGPDEVTALATSVLDQMPADEYPHFAEFARDHVLQPGYDFAAEFDYGLEVVLDGIEARLDP